MTTKVEEVRALGGVWAIYDDGNAYQVGTGRLYPGGVDALRAKVLLERMWMVIPPGGSFRPDVIPFWRMSFDEWDLLARSPDSDRAGVSCPDLRVFGIVVRCHQSMERGSVELVVEA